MESEANTRKEAIKAALLTLNELSQVDADTLNPAQQRLYNSAIANVKSGASYLRALLNGAAKSAQENR